MKSIKKEYSFYTEWANEARQLHREDGPALEYANGNKYWFLNGQRHREDGPAIERTDGYKAWFLNGKLINCSSQQEFKKLMKLKAFW